MHSCLTANFTYNSRTRYRGWWASPDGAQVNPYYLLQGKPCHRLSGLCKKYNNYKGESL